jgi:hypothetical protein
MARLLSLYDLKGSDETETIWTLGNLIELYLIATMIKMDPAHLDDFEKRALQYAYMLVDVAGPDSFPVYSTRRQMLRYVEWFGQIANLGDRTLALAKTLANKFSEDVEQRWK